MEILDADGHVNDIADQEAIAKYMPAGNRSSQIFPVLDQLLAREDLSNADKEAVLGGNGRRFYGLEANSS